MKKQVESFNTRQEMSLDRLEIFHYKDARFGEVPLHHHDFYEMYLFINGQVDYRVETEVYHLKTGDLLLLPPGIFHQPLVDPSKPYERIVLWINEKYMKDIISNKDIINFLKDKHIVSISEHYERVHGILSSIADNLKNKDDLSDTFENNSINLLIIELIRLSKTSREISSIEDANPTITQVLTYINENFSEDLNLDSLSKTFYLNKYYLSHLFSSVVGTSIHRYIVKKRLVYAHELLENGYDPSSACIKSGFKEYTNFLKSYKEEFGVSPKYHYIKN